MNPELEKIEEARENLSPGWDEARSREALGNVHRRYRRRKVARVAALAAAVILLAVASTSLLNQEESHLAFHADHAVTDGFIELADSSRVTPLDDASKISIEEVSKKKVRVAMSEGRAHYEVSKKPERRFVVELDGVEVEVLGTSFDVENSRDSVRVDVHEGRVAVRSTRTNEFHILNAGESVTIARSPEEKTETAKLAPEVDPEPEVPSEEVEVRKDSNPKVAEKKVVRSKPEPKKWRQLTDEKAYKEASEMLLADPALVDGKAVDDLFAAADAMRRSGHHAEAAAYLETIIANHQSDSRAAMAAHTRGRILDRNLSKPCQAAAAFEKAREIGLAGMLQRDALAHSSNNWAACGDASKAAKSARKYRETYGEGPHWPTLEKHLEGDVD